MTKEELSQALGFDGKQKSSRLPSWLKIITHNKKGLAGTLILLMLISAALAAPLLANHPHDRRSGRPHEAPSRTHYLGTTKLGKDVFSQLLYGARTSLTVGLVAGVLATLLAVIIGISAGYLGGTIDNILSFFMNITLVIPSLPLIIVIASFLDSASPFVIGLVLAVTGWAYHARILRTQTLVLKEKEFVCAAELIGEPSWRIVIQQIFPNMISLVVSGLVLATIYAILTEAVLEFIGLGDPSAVTWGNILYWGNRNQALLTGAWWEILPACFAIMTTGAALVLINFSVDEISNPRLRTSKHIRKLRKVLQQKGLVFDE